MRELEGRAEALAGTFIKQEVAMVGGARQILEVEAFSVRRPKQARTAARPREPRVAWRVSSARRPVKVKARAGLVLERTRTPAAAQAPRHRKLLPWDGRPARRRT